MKEVLWNFKQNPWKIPMKKIIYSKVLGYENESTHTLFQGFC